MKINQLFTYIKQFQELNKVKSYDDTVPLLEEIEGYLLDNIAQQPSNIDFVCYLASVQLELNRELEKPIQLLENFLNKYENSLTLQDKARIYTNLAYYYHDGCYFDGEPVQLKKAEQYQSAFPQTYSPLGVYYFDKKNFMQAEKYFKKAISLSDTFLTQYNLACVYYALEQYQQAEEKWQILLAENPHNQELLLSLATCTAKLAKKAESLAYLTDIIEHTSIDAFMGNIDYDNIAEVYYELEEYEKVCEIFANKEKYPFSLSNRYDYFYALWATNQQEKFETITQTEYDILKAMLAETKAEEITDDYPVKEKQEAIKCQLEELQEFQQEIKKIKQGIKPPTFFDLYIHPQCDCYLIDCIRHHKQITV